jgi:hypothetical protein
MRGIKVPMAKNLATHRIERDPERAPIIVTFFQLLETLPHRRVSCRRQSATERPELTVSRSC